MDPVDNPFAPGAGSQPPELSGRDEILINAEIALKRILKLRHAKSQILLGLRGVGKTVLLRKIDEIAGDLGYKSSYLEAPETQRLTDILYPKMVQIFKRLSIVESAKSLAHEGLSALKSFASVFKIAMGDVLISLEPELGVADSGILEYDLTDLFVKIGQAAKAAKQGWVLFIDEIQYLEKDELAALIVAIHNTTQLNLPVIFFGAGLPQVASLTGNAKSYAERLFDYKPVGALDDKSAIKAIKDPILAENELIDDLALKNILKHTKGYPFFLQEWGYQVWNIADKSPITDDDVKKASPLALRRLDEGFFRVRFDRLTPKEKAYVFAMAELGKGPYRSADIAEILQENSQQLGPCRAQIINKGMIYSPSHGDIDFTVPFFEEYLKRVT
jgi:hypothetical protein